MKILNVFYPWSDYILTGLCDVVNVLERPESIRGLYLVRSVIPFIKSELTDEQQQFVNKHILQGNYIPKSRSIDRRVIGIIECNGYSRCSDSIWDKGPKFYKLKIKRVYQLRVPMCVEDYLYIFGRKELPPYSVIKEIPLIK